MCWVCDWGVFATWGGVPRCAGCVIYDHVFVTSLRPPRGCFNRCYNEGERIVINAGRERACRVYYHHLPLVGAQGDAPGRDKVKVVVRWDVQRLTQNNKYVLNNKEGAGGIGVV